MEKQEIRDVTSEIEDIALKVVFEQTFGGGIIEDMEYKNTSLEESYCIPLKMIKAVEISSLFDSSISISSI